MAPSTIHYGVHFAFAAIVIFISLVTPQMQFFVVFGVLFVIFGFRDLLKRKKASVRVSEAKRPVDSSSYGKDTASKVPLHARHVSHNVHPDHAYKRCPSCKATVPRSYKYCPHCGWGA